MKKAAGILIATAVASVMFFTGHAQAVPIAPGSEIDFGGTVNFDTGNISTANAVTMWFNVFGTSGLSTVVLATGSFSTILPGSNAIMATPWMFDPSTPTPGLWNVGLFSFDLTSATIVTQMPGFLNITGEGTIHGTGFDDTDGTWFFTSTGGNGPRFGFTANTIAAPDGGSAVALLGIALAGIEGVRRMIRAQRPRELKRGTVLPSRETQGIVK